MLYFITFITHTCLERESGASLEKGFFPSLKGMEEIKPLDLRRDV